MALCQLYFGYVMIVMCRYAVSWLELYEPLNMGCSVYMCVHIDTPSYLHAQLIRPP